MNSYSEFHENSAVSLDVGTSSQSDGRTWRSWNSYRTPKGLLDKLISVCISEAFIMVGSHGQRNCKRILNMSVLRADCCWLTTKNNIFKTAVLHYSKCLSCVPFCKLITVGWRMQSRCLYSNVTPLVTLFFYTSWRITYVQLFWTVSSLTRYVQSLTRKWFSLEVNLWNMRD
jgi:hypothetical protein